MIRFRTEWYIGTEPGNNRVPLTRTEVAHCLRYWRNNGFITLRRGAGYTGVDTTKQIFTIRPASNAAIERLCSAEIAAHQGAPA